MAHFFPVRDSDHVFQCECARNLREQAAVYGVPFSHSFTELQISPLEVHISPIQLQISTIDLQISRIQLEISQNKLNCRYLQLNRRYLQINCRYLQILSIWRYLQILSIWRYLQLNCRYLQFDKSDKLSASRRKNRCAMIQVSGLIKSCI